MTVPDVPLLEQLVDVLASFEQRWVLVCHPDDVERLEAGIARVDLPATTVVEIRPNAFAVPAGGAAILVDVTRLERAGRPFGVNVIPP